MSFALSRQTTWACSICGAESLWKRPAHEIVHQQTKRRSRFVCEACIDAVIAGFPKDRQLAAGRPHAVRRQAG
jgi:hypothetical protein